MLFVLGIFVLQNDKIRKLIRKYLLRKHAGKAKGFYKTFRMIIKNGKAYLILNSLSTMFKLLTLSYITFFAFKAVIPLHEISIISILLIQSVIGLLIMIPISVSGIGIREPVAVLLYGQLGIEPAIILSAFLLHLVVRYLVSGLILLKLINTAEWNRAKQQ